MAHVDHLVRKFYFRTYTSDAIKMEVLKLKFLFVILVFNLGSLLYISYLKIFYESDPKKMVLLLLNIFLLLMSLIALSLLSA